MIPIDPNSSLKILISNCTDKNSPLYENAWKEFLNRYKLKIYQIVLYKCKTWNSEKIKSQLNDIVNDIVSEVFEIIPGALPGFKATDNEKSFLFWLTTISNRTASRYFKKNLFIDVIESNVIEKYEIQSDLSVDNRWELYEYLTKDFVKDNSLKRNASRDLLIFLLSTWGNFSPDELNEFYCFKDISNKVVENVISRNRKLLLQREV